ncbi:MAG: hypothetical protein R3C53_04340 [Pirellulaceae bacterium]
MDQAPLSIAWNDHGQLGLHVYSVEAGPAPSDGQRWRLKLSDGALEAQVLSREVPSAVSFEWLLSDPIVADRLAAGLAGFPPQLYLLLGPQPLRGLVNESATLSFESPQQIDQRVCHVIAIVHGPLRYRLWIDQAEMLLRRIQIPSENLAPQIRADPRVTELRLTIEIDDIRTNQRVDWERFAVAAQADDVLVTHFVPAPPVVDTTNIGERIPAFTLASPTGNTVYDSTAAKQRKATVLVWLADHPACRVAAEQLTQTASQLVDAGLPQDAIEFISVWAEPQPPPDSNFDSLAKDWNLPGQLAIDRDALGRDLFAVQEAPTLIVLDQSNRLQLRETRANPVLDQVLPTLLGRLVDGADLASEALDRNATMMHRYQAELAMASAVDGPVSPRPESYAPLYFAVTEAARHSHASAVVAAAADLRGASVPYRRRCAREL